MKAAALLAPRQLAPHQLASLRGRLLASYRENRRDLPWRRSRDPYRIWLAEIMLQQTRIAAVLPYYISAYFRSILSLASEPWRTMFALAAMAGLRAGEVLGLSMDDLDFEQRLIFVRRSAWHGRLFSPKSARSVAALPMPEPLAEMLTNYLALWRPNEKRLLFPNRRGNPYSANKVVQKKALADSRFTFNSAMWDARFPPLSCQFAHIGRRSAKGRADAVAAQRRGNHDAGLCSRARKRTTRRGGESRTSIVARCGHFSWEISIC